MLRIAPAIRANPSKREHTSVFIHAPQPRAHIIASQTLVPIPPIQPAPLPRVSSDSPSAACNSRGNPFDATRGVKYDRVRGKRARDIPRNLRRVREPLPPPLTFFKFREIRGASPPAEIKKKQKAGRIRKLARIFFFPTVHLAELGIFLLKRRKR